jgi:hypothetical protein
MLRTAFDKGVQDRSARIAVATLAAAKQRLSRFRRQGWIAIAVTALCWPQSR